MAPRTHGLSHQEERDIISAGWYTYVYASEYIVYIGMASEPCYDNMLIV